MKRKQIREKTVKQTDPLKAYRFTSLLRHILSTLYGVLLGYAIVDGNQIINYFAIFFTVVFAYVFIKTICGRFFVRVRFVKDDADFVRAAPGEVNAFVRNYTPFFYPVSYFAFKDSEYPAGRRVFFCVKPFGKMTIPVSLRYDHCGIYRLKPSAARLISAGGMVWTKPFTSKKDTEKLYVVPELREAGVDPSVNNTSDSSVTVLKNALSPTDSSYLRQYNPGDDPRYIHWKRSAQREDWLLRAFYQEGLSGFVIYMDNSLPGGLVRDFSDVRGRSAGVPVPGQDYESADKFSSAVFSLCRYMYDNEIPFVFAFRKEAGDDPDRANFVYGDAKGAMMKIRRLAGSVNFADSADDAAAGDGDQRVLSETQGLLNSGSEQTVVRLRLYSPEGSEASTDPDRAAGSFTVEGIRGITSGIREFPGVHMIVAEVRT